MSYYNLRLRQRLPSADRGLPSAFAKSFGLRETKGRNKINGAKKVRIIITIIIILVNESGSVTYPQEKDL